MTSGKIQLQHLITHFKTRSFTKRNWVAFMIVNISELEKGNGELYKAHGNIWYILGTVN